MRGWRSSGGQRTRKEQRLWKARSEGRPRLADGLTNELAIRRRPPQWAHSGPARCRGSFPTHDAMHVPHGRVAPLSACFPRSWGASERHLATEGSVSGSAVPLPPFRAAALHNGGLFGASASLHSTAAPPGADVRGCFAGGRGAAGRVETSTQTETLTSQCVPPMSRDTDRTQVGAAAPAARDGGRGSGGCWASVQSPRPFQRPCVHMLLTWARQSHECRKNDPRTTPGRDLRAHRPPSGFGSVTLFSDSVGGLLSRSEASFSLLALPVRRFRTGNEIWPPTTCGGGAGACAASITVDL